MDNERDRDPIEIFSESRPLRRGEVPSPDNAKIGLAAAKPNTILPVGWALPTILGGMRPKIPRRIATLT